MVYLVKKFRDQDAPHLFIPTLFDSQTCERAFRQFRAMGTMQFTKINFSLFELLHMVGRIEVLNDIAYFKLANEAVSLPNKRIGKTKVYSLPSDEEIHGVISIAKHEAIQRANTFGMTCCNDIDKFDFKSRLALCTTGHEESDEENYIFDEFDEANNGNEFCGDENMPICDKIDENSPFVVVKDENNTHKIVRKSTLLWMLTEPSEKLTKDRLRRFQIGRKRKTQD